MASGKPEVRRDGREYVDGVPRLLVLAKARKILDVFTLEEPQLTLAQIADRTRLPASTCLRLVRNLAHEGLLERVGERYGIGLSIVRWASSAISGRDLVAAAGPALEQLRDQTGESTLLRVREGDLAVLVAIANSNHAIVRRLRIGEVTPLHAGSGGRIFLAFDSEAGLPDGELEMFTGRTLTDRAELAAEVARIRADGYAISVEERNDGVAGLSAPVFDGRARMIGSIGVTGPADRLTRKRMRQFAPQVVAAGLEISHQFGYRA